MDKVFASKISNIIAAAQPAPHLGRCLYVEDSYANLLLVEQLVARRGDLKLLSANSGLHGVQIARDEHPDIIMMDINLPGISGLEALSILRADPLTANIPVTALSSNAFPKQIEEGLREGFFRYITKPFQLDEVNTAIDDMLRHTNETCQLR